MNDHELAELLRCALYRALYEIGRVLLFPMRVLQALLDWIRSLQSMIAKFLKVMLAAEVVYGFVVGTRWETVLAGFLSGGLQLEEPVSIAALIRNTLLGIGYVLILTIATDMVRYIVREVIWSVED